MSNLIPLDALQPGWAVCAGFLGVAQRTAHTICLADCGWSSGKGLTSPDASDSEMILSHLHRE